MLILFWEVPGDTCVLLTRRSLEMSRHAGQVSFPGGLLEAGESWEEAALREAEEEVGIDPTRVEVLGRLDDAWSGSGNHLVPVVGWLDTPPSLSANPDEVDEIFAPQVSALLRPEAISTEEILVRGIRYSNSIVEWTGGRAYGLSADLLLEALGWATGGESRRGPTRLAAKTLNHIRQALHTFCEWLFERDLIEANPIRKVRAFPVPAPTIRYLHVQIAEFAQVIRGEVFVPIARTILYAGLRRSEATWLTPADIDLRRRQLQVRAKTARAESWQPKTHRNRCLPISPKLDGVLRAQPRRGDWLFRSPKGCRWDPDNLTHRFRSTMKKAKLPWTLLDLRHVRESSDHEARNDLCAPQARSWGTVPRSAGGTTRTSLRSSSMSTWPFEG